MLTYFRLFVLACTNYVHLSPEALNEYHNLMRSQRLPVPYGSFCVHLKRLAVDTFTKTVV